MSEKQVITRFAPSPTGALHVGGARTALFAWVWARKHQGRFLIRIEDTDQKRSSRQATLGILRDLNWLGLHWDEGPDPAAADPMDLDSQKQRDARNVGPFFQSQRLELYNEQVQKLIDDGAAYVPEGGGGVVRFRMERDIAFEDAVFGQVQVKAADLEDFVIRKSDGFPTFHLAVVVDDALMGVSHVFRGQEHLSNTPKHAALYDALGFERPVWAHLPSIMNPDGSKMSKRDKAKAARKAAMEEIGDGDPNALSQRVHANQAKRMHLPGVQVDFDRYQREHSVADIISFIHGDTDDLIVATWIAQEVGLALPEINVRDFEDSGYLPGVLLNYLALLGWSPGEDIERFDMSFLVERFSIERLGKSNARFDRDKLFRFNGDTIKAMPLEDFKRMLADFAEGLFDRPALRATEGVDFSSILSDPHKFHLFAQAYHERSRTLREPFELGRFFVLRDDDPALRPDFSNKNIRKAVLKGEPNGKTILEDFQPELEGLPDEHFGAAVHDRMKSFCEERGIGNMGKLAQPLRVAISGSTVTPPIDVTLDILGKSSTLARVGLFLALEAPAEAN